MSDFREIVENLGHFLNIILMEDKHVIYHFKARDLEIPNM